jgi:nucleoside-diphosphate-sugar epimerase
MATTAPHPRRLVVTGATGFIGSAVTAHARLATHEVVGLSRSDATLAGSYEDPDALARAFAGADAVVHLAARAHRGGTDADFEGNVRAARAVAQAARTAGVPRLVFLSSIGVNGNVTCGKPFDETDVPAPVEPYARSKLRGEREVLDILDGSDTEWTIARPPLVYGPNAPGNFGRLVRAVARGIPVPVASVRNQRSLVGVDNLADAVLLCATHPAAANQLFLLADGDDVSTPDMIRCIARGLGQPARLWRVPPALLKFGATLLGRTRISQSLCDSLQVDASRVRRMLGWSPAVRTADGIAASAAAWRRA